MSKLLASHRLDANIAAALAASEDRIVITGAGGWIGLATLDLLARVLGDDFARRVHCFGSTRRTLKLVDGPTVEQQPLDQIGNLDPVPTIVLHLAFLTKDRAEAMDEQAYRAANQQIDRTVLDALDGFGAHAVFVASSGAAYRADDLEAAPAMQSYGALKVEQENAFANWAEQRERRAVIARIFNLAGPYINKQSSYALACFIRDALAGSPIQVRAPHEVVRSYVAIRELMSLVFAELLEGGAGVTRFDSGGVPMEMQQVAETVSDQLGPVAIERPERAAGSTDSYIGIHDAYSALLSQHGIAPVPFNEQVRETAEFLAFSRLHGDGERLDIGVAS